MEQKINIAELLKDAPKGTKLWSALDGNVALKAVQPDSSIQIYVENCESEECGYFYNGKPACYPYSEVMLFPSKDCRTWENFKAPWKHKHFKPFEKVLTRNGDNWECDFFKGMSKDGFFLTIGGRQVYEEDDIIPFEGNVNLIGKEVNGVR